MDLTDKQQLIQYLKSHGLYTQKKLGQNFLVDRDALEKIVEAAELKPEDCVVEVGPGVGTMTEELVKQAGRVAAVEIDEKLANLLACQFSIFSSQFPINQQCSNYQNWLTENSMKIAKLKTENSELDIINSDILKVNIVELTKDCSSYKVVANIPYYITSKILRYFLEAGKKPETIVLLTQKEVAEQITAKPGQMSLLSVSVQAYGEPEIVGIVKADSFFPAPKVDSAILRIIICQQSAVGSKLLSVNRQQQAEFFRCVRIGFSSKRKTLLNNLSAGYHLEKEKVLGILKESELNENTRAQELEIEEWKNLSQMIEREL